MKSIFVSIIFLSMSAVNGFTQDVSALRKKTFNLEKNLAIQGYDPVAYFKQNEPVKGKSEFSVSHLGVIYYFSSAENKNVFLKDPTVYGFYLEDWIFDSTPGKNWRRAKTFQSLNSTEQAANPHIFMIPNTLFFLHGKKLFATGIFYSI